MQAFCIGLLHVVGCYCKRICTRQSSFLGRFQICIFSGIIPLVSNLQRKIQRLNYRKEYVLLKKIEPLRRFLDKLQMYRTYNLNLCRYGILVPQMASVAHKPF